MSIIGKPDRAFVAFDIKKSACMTLNFNSPLGFLQSWKKDPFKWRNTAVIVFDGFNYDPRPVWLIPECVKYYKELEKSFPYLLAFVRYNPAEAEMQLWGLDMYIKMMLIDQQKAAMPPYAMVLDLKKLYNFIMQKVENLRELFPPTAEGQKQYDALESELYLSFNYWIEKNHLIPNT
jgi:hypothetical protein